MWWDFFRDVTEKLDYCSWVLPRTIFAGTAGKKAGQAMKVWHKHHLCPLLHMQIAGFEVHHHPCTHAFAGSRLVTVLSLSLLP